MKIKSFIPPGIFIVGAAVFYMRMGTAQENSAWKAFSLQQLSKQRGTQERAYLRFLDEASFSAGLYELQSGDTDRQTPHKWDEVYYVRAGRAWLVVQTDTLDAYPGSIFFVRARVPHRFVAIEEDLQVVVVFSKTPSSHADPQWLAFSPKEVEGAGKKNANAWSPLCDVSSMRFGLYILPPGVGGDEPQVHDVDALNIILRGRARFGIGADAIETQPGSIVWVQHGKRHTFQRLKEDVDVLVLFAKKGG